jgi:hypothetical protein
MSKKSIVLIGEPGSGKSTSLETLPRGMVDFNFDPQGWLSLQREGEALKVAQSVGRRPKKLIFAPSIRKWAEGKENILQPDNILVIDYSAYSTPMNTGMLTNYDSKIYFEFGQDINDLEKNWQMYSDRGLCHIGVDSLTGLQWYVLHGMVSLAAHSSKGTSQYTYGLAIEKMREIIDTCCHLPFDFILTTHVESEKDEIVGKIQETILLYGKKLPGILLSMIDDIYYCSMSTMTGKREYFFETQPQMFLRIIRQRSFDNLPIKLKPDFSALYQGKLYEGIKK